MQSSDTNWPTLLAGSDRRGGSFGGRKTGPNELIWKATLTESIRSSPVLRGDVVYATCLDGCLYAFDAKTGRERWRFQTGAAIHSTPSISESLVFTGSDDGALYALDRSSGRQVWKTPGE